MAAPNVTLHPEPMQGDVITFQKLAAPKKGGQERAQVSLLLKITNHEPADIVLRNVGIRIFFSDNSTPFDVSNPVSIHVPAGGFAYWYPRVYTAVTAGVETRINQNIIISPLANILQFRLEFKNFTDEFRHLYALRPHQSPTPEHAYRFPARTRDLRWNEAWFCRAAANHNEDDWGNQLFALDVGCQGWSSEKWSVLLPGGSDSVNEEYRIWGKPIYAMADGNIRDAQWDWPTNDAKKPLSAEVVARITANGGQGPGNFVSIETDDEFHIYCHMQAESIPAKFRNPGAVIKQGDFLGNAGNSGRSSNPHLHIGINKKINLVMKGGAKEILRPMPFVHTQTINSDHASGTRSEDPWFRNEGHGLSQSGAYPNCCLVWPSWYGLATPRLVLKEFRCVEESDEVGSDSPYFIVFVGRRYVEDVQSRIVRVRKASWDDNVDRGELRRVNEDITGQVDTKTFVLVALMEEDFDPDISGSTFDAVKSDLKEAFKSAASGPGVSMDDVETLMKAQFLLSLAKRLQNDECLGIKRLEITTEEGLLPLLTFTGDGSKYNVRFETRR